MRTQQHAACLEGESGYALLSKGCYFSEQGRSLHSLTDLSRDYGVAPRAHCPSQHSQWRLPTLTDWPQALSYVAPGKQKMAPPLNVCENRSVKRAADKLQLQNPAVGVCDCIWHAGVVSSLNSKGECGNSLLGGYAIFYEMCFVFYLLFFCLLVARPSGRAN